ncbi:MAG: hypothetical protein IJC98_02255 [Clostridia bacterium]|nr:hypothetical protein [Clostridia bacterium]
MKKYRFHIGLTLLVQSASFVVLFFMLYKKKKSLAGTFLALSAIGGIAGAYLVLKEAKSEVEACEQAARDAYEYEGCDESLCNGCFGDCEECGMLLDEDDDSCEITVEEYVEDEGEDTEASPEVDLEEEVVEEEPAEDIFTETVEDTLS